MFRVFEYHPYPYLSIYVCRILLCRIPHGFMSSHINHVDPNFVNPSLATAILATSFALLSPAMRTVYWFQSSYSSEDIGMTTALTSITVAACGASIGLLHDRFFWHLRWFYGGSSLSLLLSKPLPNTVPVPRVFISWSLSVDEPTFSAAAANKPTTFWVSTIFFIASLWPLARC